MWPLAVQQRFSTGKNDPPDSEAANGFEMRLEIHRTQRARVGCFPDVAHHAAAVARAVRVQDENGKLSYAVVFGVVRRSADGDQIMLGGHGAPFFRQD